MTMYAGDEYAATDPDLDDDGPWEDPAPAPVGDPMSAAELIQAMTDACAASSNAAARFRRHPLHRPDLADTEQARADRLRDAIEVALEHYRLADEARS